MPSIEHVPDENAKSVHSSKAENAGSLTQQQTQVAKATYSLKRDSLMSKSKVKASAMQGVAPTQNVYVKAENKITEHYKPIAQSDVY